MCSHQVPQVPKFFPQDLPINTPDLYHMVCAKFNSHENKLKVWAVEEHICFYFATGCAKRSFYWRVPIVLKIGCGPMNMAPSKYKIKL